MCTEMTKAVNWKLTFGGRVQRLAVSRTFPRTGFWLSFYDDDISLFDVRLS